MIFFDCLLWSLSLVFEALSIADESYHDTSAFEEEENILLGKYGI